MIPRAFITSGILQDYCLGLLSNEAERKVEAMCGAYPQVAKELKLLQDALQLYTDENRKPESEALRRSVWEAVKKLWEDKN